MTRARRSEARRRRAFALLGVLWVIASASALGLTVRVVAGDALAAIHNRIGLLRAAWIAEGCLERARAALADALAVSERASVAWIGLDTLLRTSSLTVGCDVLARPGGIAINVNDKDSTIVARLLLEAGVQKDRADSLIDALLDWRDSDDDERPFGAESAWYAARHRPAPRNGSLTSLREVAMIRGFEMERGIDSLFGVDSERVALARAPLPVIAALPGMTPEAVARTVAQRTSPEGIGDLSTLPNALSPEARELLLRHYAELVGRATWAPETWTVTARGASGRPPIEATVEIRIVRSGSRAAIVRRRSWP